MEEFPRRHIPRGLRIHTPQKRKKETFACGYKQTGTESYGMFAGPFPKLKKALDTIPAEGDTEVAYIIHFRSNGTERPIYVWRTDQWVRLPKS